MDNLNTAYFVEERYRSLVNEFESELKRSLTENERAFIEWMIDQELTKEPVAKSHSLSAS